MVTNAFVGQAEPPTDAQLGAELGDAKPVWDRLLQELAQEQNLTTREWNSCSRKAEWSLRLKKGERNIVYLSPGRGEFTASFALGDKAVEASRKSELPARVHEIIGGAKRYAEGTAVRLDVHRTSDIAAIKKLAAIKAEH